MKRGGEEEEGGVRDVPPSCGPPVSTPGSAGAEGQRSISHDTKVRIGNLVEAPFSTLLSSRFSS